MVKLNRIYTRTGDDGTTGLVGGRRISKADLRLEAIGTVDEANCAIGLARLHAAADPSIDAMLAAVQNDLFDLGSDLATPADDQRDIAKALRISPVQTARIEAAIDQLNAALQPLRSFVLPGGSAASAALHLARAVVRRAERTMVAVAEHPGDEVGREALRYINRLSDFLFVAARSLNDNGTSDVLWVPGKNRQSDPGPD